MSRATDTAEAISDFCSVFAGTFCVAETFFTGWLAALVIDYATIVTLLIAFDRAVTTDVLALTFRWILAQGRTPLLLRRNLRLCHIFRRYRSEDICFRRSPRPFRLDFERCRYNLVWRTCPCDRTRFRSRYLDRTFWCSRQRGHLLPPQSTSVSS